MSRVDFFNKDFDLEQTDKINKAPITNLGPESNFGSVDEDLRRSGNSTSLSSISAKHITEKNRLHAKVFCHFISGGIMIFQDVISILGVRSVRSIGSAGKVFLLEVFLV